MSSNHLKTPLALSLNEFTSKRVLDAVQLSGKALPCSVISVDGPIVTVQFEVTSDYTLPHVTIPVIGSEYVRVPVQPGDRGVVMPCDVRIGNVSGLGASTPPGLDVPANLTALIFVPVGNKNWFSVDGQSLVLYGPGGVILMDEGQATIVHITPTEINITLPSGGNVNVTGGDVIADGISLKTHTHPGVQTGTGDTGEPNP